MPQKEEAPILIICSKQIFNVWGLGDPYCDPLWALSTNETELGCDFVEPKFSWERKVYKYKIKSLTAIIESALKEEYRC